MIKRAHDGSAKEHKKTVQQKVREHNQNYAKIETIYVLLMPKAHVISEDLIAMAKTNAPSVIEILGCKAWRRLKSGRQRTARGQKFFQELQAKHGVTKKQLREAATRLEERTGIYWGNILLLRVENRKFVFMPLVDKH